MMRLRTQTVSERGWRHVCATAPALALGLLLLIGLAASPGARAQATAGADSGSHAIVAAAEQGSSGPALFIGGAIGVRGEVFVGQMPVAPDDQANGAGDDESAGDDYLAPPPSVATLAGVEQTLDLTVDARFGGAVQAFARLSTSGVWGVGSASDASPWMPPVARPLFVDEAWVRYSTPSAQVSAGKQRFSLGPVGLLGRTDLEAPEAVRVDAGFGDWLLTGVWSRLSSGYYYNSSFVTRADDLLAARVARSWSGGVIAGNYLASGLGDEAGCSVDVAGSALGRAFTAELAFFRSSSTVYPEYRTEGWVPAFVAKLEAANTPIHRLELSYGRVAPGFAPYYSSVASRSGGQALPFDQNTEGVALDYSRRLSPSAELNVRLAGLRFLDLGEAGDAPGDASGDAASHVAELVPTLSTAVRVMTDIGPGMALEAGYEHWRMKAGTSYGRFSLGVTVRF